VRFSFWSLDEDSNTCCSAWFLLLSLLDIRFSNITQVAQQAQNPPGPGQRFATHPGAPTEEEIEREEKRLEQKVQQDRAAAAAAAGAKSQANQVVSWLAVFSILRFSA
jgi:hypothetical protein